MKFEKKDKCKADYVWSWSKDKAKEYRESCKKTKDCISLTVKGTLYTKEQCVNIIKSFGFYLAKEVIRTTNLNLLILKKNEYFEVCYSDWKKHMEEKYKTEFKGKVIESTKSKLKKLAKHLREKFIEDFDKLDLTKITYAKLKEIATNNKELKYDVISDMKKEQQQKRDMKKMRREFAWTNLMVILNANTRNF